MKITVTYLIKKTRGLFFISLILSHFTGLSTVNNFNHLTIREGLSQSTVTALFQDKSGFMWIGTMDGLNRYDGYSFTTYFPQRNIISLSNASITSIAEDQQGRLWVGTQAGLNILDQATKEFSHVPVVVGKDSFQKDVINALFLDKNECMWVGTNHGLAKYYYKKIAGGQNSLIQYQFGDKEWNVSGKILQIGEDERLGVWVLTDEGVFAVDGNGNAKELPFSAQVDGRHVKCIFFDEKMIYAGFNEGVYLIGRDQDVKKLEPVNYNNEPILDATFIKKDLGENIWIGTQSDGVYVYDINTEKTYNHINSTIIDASLNSDVVNSMFVTRSGLVAIGTDLGVNLYNERQGLFNQLSLTVRPDELVQNVHGMIQDDHGNILIGTTGSGFYIINQEGEILRHFIDDNLWGSVKCICQDKDGYYWLGTIGKGICRLSFRGNNYERPQLVNYQLDPNKEGSFPSNDVYDIFEDMNGDIWFGTSNGLCLLPYSRKQDIGGKINFINVPLHANGEMKSAETSVYSIYRDRLGVLWVGTMRRGLARTSYNRSGDSFSHAEADTFLIKFDWFYNDLKNDYSLAGDNVYCIYEDKHLGNIWIGTNTGLCKYDREENNFRVFTIENGLPNNVIYGILEDADGCLWVSTNNGLSKYNQKEDVFYNYGVSNGLQYPEFNGKAYLKVDNGLLIFGGAKGINSFYPEKIRQGSSDAPVYITGFKIKNNKITSNDETRIFTQPIYQTSKIQLKHNQNFFTISFSLLNFENQEQNRFAYKLEGFQDEWIYLIGDHSASFTGIPPGKYKFVVKGSDGYSIWETKGQELGIEILPPWWLTASAKSFYLIFFLSVSFFFWNEYRRRMRLRLDMEKQRLAYQKNQELYEERLEFYANISHEFLTPLTLITGPVQDLLMELTDKIHRNKAMLINKNVARLKRLIDEVLSLRKLDSGMMRIQVDLVEVEDFVRDVASGFNSMAVRREIRFACKSEVINERIWLDKDVVEKILYNLLSNAFKYTKNGGEIAVQIKEVNGTDIKDLFKEQKIDSVIHEKYIAVKIKDNGTGISKEEKAYIFDRYFQSDARNNGFGIGLAFSKKMAILHNGTIEVKSKLGKGSSFTLYLPVGDIYTSSQKAGEKQTVKKWDYSELMPLPNIEGQKDNIVKNTILLVEDNDEMRYYILEALRYEFNIVVAENGEIALEKLADNKIDLVISDIIMPVKDGVELTREMAGSKFSHIPVILLSAINDSGQKQIGMEAGAKAYVTKPFEIPYLVTVVKRVLLQAGKLKNKADENILDIELTTNIESYDDKLLNQLKKSIEEHYSDQHFNVNLLAEDIGISRSQLHRKFKAITGETPSNFLKETRMKEAVRLLETSDVPISEICYAVGFSDPKYFSREFRKKYGMSPSAFAQPHRKNRNLR